MQKYRHAIGSDPVQVLHMPLWTLPELLQARQQLCPSTSVQEMEKRFLFWGGSAMQCLNAADPRKLDSVFSLANAEEVERAIGSAMPPSEVCVALL